jgi:spoIIIJ-associated protein
MIYEFEGRTEKEAIDRAAEELGLEKDDFDVEIIENQRSGLFKKGYVKIQVHTNQNGQERSAQADEDENYDEIDRRAFEKAQYAEDRKTGARQQRDTSAFGEPEPKDDFEKKMVDFVEGLIQRMGYEGKASILFREERKLGLKIDSEYSSILIGKRGKNMDAIQLLANIYAGRSGREDVRIILDSENYRIRREESLVRLAYTVADKVRGTRGSILLEPMNPFDRRLVHTTLNDINDVETKSEGEGLYKQVRVYYRGMGRK